MEPPALLVFIAVDQFRPDYLARYRLQFTGGLARLLKGGAFFTEAYQDHAITETAPGHASMMSGRFPRSTGITRNVLGVNVTDAPLLRDPGATPLNPSLDLGASPRRFRGTTLTDWLIAKDPRSRALSVSMKDRAAILPIGRSKQQVYWSASNGTLTTSTYYADTLPAWVRRFNARQLPQGWAGKTWTLLLPDMAYTEADSVRVESFGRDYVFPHPFPADSAKAANWFRYAPMMDELSLQFALEGLQRLGLGQGPAPDLVAISLSSTDAVGHRFGPDSREMHDQIVRLDRYLGAFIDSLFRLRDSTRIIFALTADHGVAPVPELAGKRFSPPPERVEIDPAMAAARAVLRQAGADTNAADFESGAFFLDSTNLGSDGLKPETVVDGFVAAARKLPGVMRVDRWSDLAKRDTLQDPIARRWLHMFSPDMQPRAVVTLTLGSMYNAPLVATHGSPHDYDARVPVIFYGAPFKPGRYDQFVRVVDMGPTLAKVLGVTPTERLDGQVLTAAIR